MGTCFNKDEDANDLRNVRLDSQIKPEKPPT